VNLTLLGNGQPNDGCINYMQLLLTDRNYSVSMMLAVQPTPEFVSIPHNVTYLTGVITGSEIGLHGNTSSLVSASV